MNVLDVDIQRAGYQMGRTNIHDIAFSVGQGELVGMIGSNGAGKSTTIKSILKLLPYLEGTITLSEPYAYVPEQPVFYDDLTLWEHLEFSASVHGLSEEAFSSRVNELLEKFSLDHVKNECPAQFSKGMQQKMLLILGFLAHPDVYIVDEPFVGLDPKATRDFLRLLDQERERGAGVLMCTHVLDTAERICDRIVIIDQGKKIVEGTLEEVRQQAGLPSGSLFDCFNRLVNE
jgi:ABC-2 type transport system ATP-binding protein